MYNETLRVIENRKSTRKYASVPVTQEEKAAILHAAMRSPTAGNMMMYSMIEVEDQTIKDRLAVSCDHQPFIAEAPYVVLFLADYQRLFDFYTYCGVEAECKEKGISPRLPQEGDLLLACCDALIAAQTAVIAAESMGIGSCYIGDILENADFHRELFDLPRYTLPISLVCFGRPFSEKEEKHLTPRFNRELVAFTNRYHRLTQSELTQLYASTAAKNSPNVPVEEAVMQIGRNIYFRKFVSDFSVEMTRSARQWISQWNGNPD